MRRALHGHLCTLGAVIRDGLRPERAPRDRSWETWTEDPQLGPLRLRGRLLEQPGADSLLLVVHGMGGSLDSRYARVAAREAEERGLSCLRLNLRGADRGGAAIYHAGLSDDVAAALASPTLDRYQHILLLGYSLGGHLLLRYASGGARDPRVRALATVCAPLDLEQGARDIHRPAGRLYERYLLVGLKEVYRAFVARRRPPRVADLDRVRSLFSWDQEVIAPHFGFDGALDYYEQVSAGPHLGRIELPTLFVAAEEDPMVLASQLTPWLAHASPALRALWTQRGGHVGFPAGLDLGIGGPSRNVHAQIIHWLAAQADK